MMKRETDPLIKPSSFHKQNPLFAKLVLLFMLLGVTIFLFSSRSIDYSNSGLQTQRFDSQETKSEETDILIASESSDDDLETRTFLAGDTEESETGIHESDKASASSTSAELEDEQAAPSTSTESHKDEAAASTLNDSQSNDATPSTSNESLNDEAEPSSSTESHEDETAPSTSSKLHNNEAASSNSTDSQNNEAAPSTSVELQKDEAAPSATESHKEEPESIVLHKDEAAPAAPSTSDESQTDEAAPSTSTDSQDNEAAPSTPTDSQNNEAVSSTSAESRNNEAILSTSAESQNNEVIPSTSANSQHSQAAPSNSTESHKGEGTPSTSTDSHNKIKPKCDLFKGVWVPNPSGPAYNNYSCPMIEGQQNCMKNGRPDTGYLYWKWKPNDCELPKFNPQTFLDFMRNKYFAFIGDSISRNHIQSMLCILSQVEEPKMIYLDEEWRSSTWIFPSYNFTIARIWSPFLLKADSSEDSNGVTTSFTEIHLDKLDEKWTNQYPKFDYVLISGVQWFMKNAIYNENNTAIGCHSCPPGLNLTEIGFLVPYGKVLNRVYDFITSSAHKPHVLFRTIAPSHFENGDWGTGGNCHRKVPFQENEMNMTVADKTLYEIQVHEFEKAVSKGSAKLKLFDTTQLSMLRADGHPGEYRQYQPFAKDKNAKVQSDCLHWCLPGPIDSWNDLLMETLINA